MQDDGLRRPPDSGETDEAAYWQAVYENQSPRLRRLVARRLGRSDGVDDVVQDTFLRAYRSRETFDRSLPIEPWLTTIALRQVKEARRRASTAAAVVFTDASNAVWHDPEETLSRRVGIETAMASLNERHRQLLLLVAVEGVRRTVVAAREELDPAAVRAALMRARRQFLKAYTKATEERLAGLVTAGLVRARARLHRLEAAVGARADAAACLAAVAAATLGLTALGASTVVPGTSLASQGAEITMPPRSAEREATATARPVELALEITPSRTSLHVAVATDPALRRSAVRHAVDIPAGQALASAERTADGATFDVRIRVFTTEAYVVAEVANCDATYTSTLHCTLVDVLDPLSDYT